MTNFALSIDAGVTRVHCYRNAGLNRVFLGRAAMLQVSLLPMQGQFHSFGSLILLCTVILLRRVKKQYDVFAETVRSYLT